MKKDSIRRNISLLMEEFGITSESQLARETGLGQGTVNKLIAGVTEDPRLSTLLPIAERFKLTLDTLVSDSPNFSHHDSDNGESKVSYIPIVLIEELSDIIGSLNSLHTENWPYWFPLYAYTQNSCYAVKVNKNNFPEPFGKNSTLICEKTLELMNDSYCLVKHFESDSISIMKVLKEAGKIWLESLKKELPIQEYSFKNWVFLGTIRGVMLDMSNDEFFANGTRSDT